MNFLSNQLLICKLWYIKSQLLFKDVEIFIYEEIH